MSDIHSIADLTPDPSNRRKHNPRNIGMIVESLQKVGAARSIVIDEQGNILAGNGTVDAAAEAGIERVQVVDADGETLIAVRRTGLTDEQKRKLALYDNRTAELAEWDTGQIAADLEAGLSFEGLFSTDEINGILENAADELLAGEMLGVPKDAKPNPRNLPIDVIFCWGGGDTSCCLAVRAGWKYGVRSSDIASPDRVCPVVPRSTRHAVTFIDNEFKEYDHQHHLEIVSHFKPKYATVRDIMTPEQCTAAGITFYPYEQIMEWAEELAEHAENVIVIPKYNCLDRIPDKFVLGYSVPTEYGGTPLPVESFRGRRVHLLGGSWKAQLAHMAQLGDDVISVDNNHVERIASRWGEFIDPDGNARQMKAIGLGYLINVRDAALVLSFGAIGAKVNELYAGTATPA